MQEQEAVFRREMSRNNLRITENRLTIFRMLAATKQPLSIQKIIEKLDGKSHFTSVYRSLADMTKAGIVREIPHGFKNLYELGDKFHPHHHHATCEVCGKTSTIHDEKLENLMRELTLSAGLKPTRHQFELFGICLECRGEIS